MKLFRKTAGTVHAVSAYGMKAQIPAASFSLRLWPRSIFSRAPRPDSHAWFQPVRFTLAVGEQNAAPRSVCLWVCAHLRAATEEPALAPTLGSRRTCSWWSQTSPPWRKAEGTARCQTSCCRQRSTEQKIRFMLMHQHTKKTKTADTLRGSVVFLHLHSALSSPGFQCFSPPF